MSANRFTIYWHAGMNCYRVSEPNLSSNGERIEVVRCDDAAIERAARALYEDNHRIVPLNQYRAFARIAFEAAGTDSA